jgi:acyl-CoA thioesterase-1
MARLFERPPVWASTTLVVGLALLVLGVVFSVTRGGSDTAAAEAVKLHIQTPAGRPLKVLFSGDSITHGYFASDRAHTWPALVAAGLGTASQVSVTNPAVPGYTVTQGLTETVPSGVDLAFVMYGNNDIRVSDLATFRSDYAKLLGNIKAKNPQAHIVCVSPWLAPAFSPRGTSTAEFSAAAQLACTAAHGRFVDVSRKFSQTLNAEPGARSLEGGLVTDTTHPGDTGHKVIADEVLAQVVITR